LVETENVKNKVIEPKNRQCGIDLGLKDFAIITNDTGIYKIEHPKYLIKAEKRLKILQRALSRKQEGSKNREKARKRLAIQHEYVSNARNDFLHKLSKAIIDDNQVIVVEDRALSAHFNSNEQTKIPNSSENGLQHTLNVKGMQKTDLAKPVSDSGFGTFVRYLEYKADWYGRQLIKVDRFYPSSKLCQRLWIQTQRIKTV